MNTTQKIRRNSLVLLYGVMTLITILALVTLVMAESQPSSAPSVAYGGSGAGSGNAGKEGNVIKMEKRNEASSDQIKVTDNYLKALLGEKYVTQYIKYDESYKESVYVSSTPYEQATDKVDYKQVDYKKEKGITTKEDALNQMDRMLKAFDRSNIKKGYVVFSFSDDTTKEKAVAILEKNGLKIDQSKVCGPVSNSAQQPKAKDIGCKMQDSWIDMIKVATVKVPEGKEKQFAEKLVKEESKVLWAEPDSVMSLSADLQPPKDQANQAKDVEVSAGAPSQGAPVMRENAKTEDHMVIVYSYNFKTQGEVDPAARIIRVSLDPKNTIVRYEGPEKSFEFKLGVDDVKKIARKAGMKNPNNVYIRAGWQGFLADEYMVLGEGRESIMWEVDSNPADVGTPERIYIDVDSGKVLGILTRSDLEMRLVSPPIRLANPLPESGAQNAGADTNQAVNAEVKAKLAKLHARVPQVSTEKKETNEGNVQKEESKNPVAVLFSKIASFFASIF